VEHLAGAEQPVPAVAVQTQPTEWAQAQRIAYQAGATGKTATERIPLAEADGRVLADGLRPATDLPPFPTSTVDGWAVRGAAPWRIVGRVLAGEPARPLTADGTCVQIATGAMVPEHASAILRLEDSHTSGDSVSGTPRAEPEWRLPGDEARRGEELLPAGTAINPGVLGFAAACGYDALEVYRRPRSELVVFGDELLTAGSARDGRVRDSLGPSLPAWLRRLGADAGEMTGPVADSLDAHVAALSEAAARGSELICTTGGTMHGPVDHLHPALAALGASYLVNTVAVRPGFPMLLAQLPSGQFVAGLPGNPQSAVVALVSLVAPLLTGLRGAPAAELTSVTLERPVSGRGNFTHLVLVTTDGDGRATAIGHAASSMLRGLAQSTGFAVIRPHTSGRAGDRVPLVPLPLVEGRR
jgi:molybdopterin molybdotransferase